MMKNGMRRLLSLWMALVMTVSLVMVPAAAEDAANPPAAESAAQDPAPAAENSPAVTLKNLAQQVIGTKKEYTLPPSCSGIPEWAAEKSENTRYSLVINPDPKADGKTYTWLRDGQRISGASGEVYTVVPTDRGRTIRVKVTAEDYTGELVPSPVAIPAGASGKPTATVTAGDQGLAIRWNAPSDNGGAPVTGCKLKIAQGTEKILEIDLTSDMTSYTLEGLSNGKAYDFTLSAVNSAGSGESGTAADTPTASGGNNPGGGNSSGGGDDDDTEINGNVSISATTTVNPDGSKTTVDTKKDGTVIVTVKKKDGSAGTTATDASGQINARVQLPSGVTAGATDGGAISLPVQGIRASQSIDRAPVLTIETSGVNGVKVDIPVVNKGPSIVAVLIKADGTGQIMKNTVPTQAGIAVRVNSGDTLKILDNRKVFADITGHWAADAAAFVSSRELFLGTAPNTFSPNAKMTRGMLLTVLARYENVNTEGGAAYYEKGAAWAMANGLSDGSRLSAEITREQLAAILYRYAILKNKLSGEGADLRGYEDANRVSEWASDAMSWAVGAGLIKGTAPTALDPQGGATRAQVAAIIMRYAETFGL